MAKQELIRCQWAGTDPLYIKYHDHEWAKPVHDDRKLFEMLTLEGFQAGLSWITILKKRTAFITAFDNFDVVKISNYSDAKVAKLLNNPSIVRNRLKIGATIKNAQGFIALQKEFESFDTYLWNFTNKKTIFPAKPYKTIKEIPCFTDLSDRISKDLKKRGFSFVGTTIIYSFLQAVGVVNDHVVSCFASQQ